MVMVNTTGHSTPVLDISFTNLVQLPVGQGGRGLHPGGGRHDVAAHHDVRLGDGLLPDLPGGEVREGGVLGCGDWRGLAGLEEEEIVSQSGCDI